MPLYLGNQLSLLYIRHGYRATVISFTKTYENGDLHYHKQLFYHLWSQKFLGDGSMVNMDIRTGQTFRPVYIDLLHYRP